MRDRFALLVLVVVFGGLGVLGGCGKEIGDACFNGIDCSPNGDRACIDAVDNAVETVEGYCTVRGCDYSTCPEEAVCVQFFTGSFGNKACDPVCDGFYGRDPDRCPAAPPATDADMDGQPDIVQCSIDEICPLQGHCIARSSEVRYCMRTCDSDGDCRDGYECRDLDRMQSHGGQPVLRPIDLGDGGQRRAVIDTGAPKFCAKAPR